MTRLLRHVRFAATCIALVGAPVFSASGQGSTPLVETFNQVTGAKAEVRLSTVPSTPPAIDAKSCNDLAGCTISADATLTSGEGQTGAASGSTTTRLEPGDDVVPFQFSGQSAFSASAFRPDEIPGTASASGLGNVTLEFTTTRPLFLDFAFSASIPSRNLALGFGRAQVWLGLRGEIDGIVQAQLLEDGSYSGPTRFSGDIPAGSYQLFVSGQFVAQACRLEACEVPDGSGSFSFSLTLGEEAPVVRWVNPAGGAGTSRPTGSPSASPARPIRPSSTSPRATP